MKSWFMFFVAVVLMAKFAFGVSIAPQIVKQLKETGQLQSIVQADRDARARGVWQANPTPFRFGATADVETLHCLIILVDFDDMPHENGFHSEPANFDTLLFSFGLRSPGSMADYYRECSYSQAYLTGQVTQWYRMPQLYSYYVDGQRGFGSYPHNAQRLTEDAVTAADPDVDYSLFDNDNDGVVDALFVVHAGPGYEDTGNLNYIHSHAWVMSHRFYLDGVELYRYSMEPEETGSHQLVTIGVFCHEFGHVLGLPDLYDTDYSSQGVGDWSVMAGGSWGGGGARPVHFDAWSKYQLGWAIPTVLIDNLIQEPIDAVEYNPDTYQLFSLGLWDPQYFMVENRRQRLFDLSLPGQGLLIYHIDESVPDNTDENHYKVAVEQADGNFDLENNRSADGGDPWPGWSDNRTFDDFSTPDSRLYNGNASQVSVTNISDSDSTMYADLAIMYDHPLYELLSLSFDDSSGNGNGLPEPGETCNIIFSARNTRLPVDELQVTASCSDPRVAFSDSISSFGPLPIDQPFDNLDDPITFSLPDDYDCSYSLITLRFVAQDGQYVQEIDRRVILGNPNLLLVDDNRGQTIDTFYMNPLASLGQAYAVWHVATQGSPDSILAHYENVIWFTGGSRADTVPPEDVDSLISYLDRGGHLMVTSQDFVQNLSARNSPRDTLLLRRYLKVDYSLRENDHREDGQSGTVFDSLTFYSAGIGGANNQVSQDALLALNGGEVLMSYRSGDIAAVGAVDGYRALTFGFGAEGINNSYPSIYDTRIDFMQAALNYLLGPVSVLDPSPVLPGRISLDQNYPNPFNPTTRIAFEIPSTDQVNLSVYDILGRLIDKPVDEVLTAGGHVITWDGSRFPSGIYFYRLTVGNHSITKRMTLAK
jgi:immune inhibitor A